MRRNLTVLIVLFCSLCLAAESALIVRTGINHEQFESLLREHLPKGQVWADYTNWKSHLGGMPKHLPADIEIRAAFDLSVWVLYTPETGQVVIGPEKRVKEFARKTWK